MKLELKKILFFLILILSIQKSYTQCSSSETALYITISGGDFLDEKWIEITSDTLGTGIVIWNQDNGNN